MMLSSHWSITDAATTPDCQRIEKNYSLTWNGLAVKQGQKWQLTLLESTKIFKIDNGKEIFVREVKKGERLPIYAFATVGYRVSDNLFIRRDTKVKVVRIPSSIITIAQCTHELAQDLTQNASQKIVVTKQPATMYKATLETWTKEAGRWIKKSTTTAVIGKKGIGKTIEGDAKTPKGNYALGTAFGWGNKPISMKYPFKKATKIDYWVDDPSSKDYNKWITYKGNPANRWKSYERMNQRLYKYGVVIMYNQNPIISGRGSAIFLHQKNNDTVYTNGCIALNESEIVALLKWLDPNKKPIIEIK